MKLSHRTDVLKLPSRVTRLVVLGDPHGDVPGVEAVLAAEKGDDVAFVSVGDNVGYGDGEASSKLVDLLKERGIASVYGNHEHWIKTGGGRSRSSRTPGARVSSRFPRSTSAAGCPRPSGSRPKRRPTSRWSSNTRSSATTSGTG